MVGTNGDVIKLLRTSQRVRLVTECKANKLIKSPILGFFIKDRLGQYICGDNTIRKLPKWKIIGKGKTCTVVFDFIMPALATGNYSLGVAIAEGTQSDHVQHHWIHDAIDFEVQSDPHMTGWFMLEGMKCEYDEESDKKALDSE